MKNQKKTIDTLEKLKLREKQCVQLVGGEKGKGTDASTEEITFVVEDMQIA